MDQVENEQVGNVKNFPPTGKGDERREVTDCRRRGVDGGRNHGDQGSGMGDRCGCNFVEEGLGTLSEGCSVFCSDSVWRGVYLQRQATQHVSLPHTM